MINYYISYKHLLEQEKELGVKAPKELKLLLFGTEEPITVTEEVAEVYKDWVYIENIYTDWNTLMPIVNKLNNTIVDGELEDEFNYAIRITIRPNGTFLEKIGEEDWETIILETGFNQEFENTCKVVKRFFSRVPTSRLIDFDDDFDIEVTKAQLKAKKH